VTTPKGLGTPVIEVRFDLGPLLQDGSACDAAVYNNVPAESVETGVIVREVHPSEVLRDADGNVGHECSTRAGNRAAQ
jgi:hypothetical protein